MSQNDPMFDVFIFETQQLLESLEETLLQSEKQRTLTEEHINEIFRIMHTIKGSASMMSYDNLAKLAHALEDLFDKIREGRTRTDAVALENVFELVLDSADKFKSEIDKLASGMKSDNDFSDLIPKIHKCLAFMLGEALPEEYDLPSTGAVPASFSDGNVDAEDDGSPIYKIKVVFEEGCQMENLRAFGVVTALTPLCNRIVHIPSDLNDESSSVIIAQNGLVVFAQSSENPDTLRGICDGIMFLKNSSLVPIDPDSEELPSIMRREDIAALAEAAKTVSSVSAGADEKTVPEFATARQNFISVNVNKLDKLMNLMGEIVTTESMVTKNPEVADLHIDSFERSSQELRKLINELQDIVMSIRMLPVSTAFQKMHRIVRDVSKKVGKEVELVLIGEETEVDKNIIDTLNDPLMHLIRNAVDHGIELPETRIRNGKPAGGTITLEARNAGGDVVILITDDGQGLSREKILKKAADKGLLTKPEHEMSDREVYHLIFAPGFSTNQEVTEFSGRGVGMDVVKRNIDKVGGSIGIDSNPGKGMTIQLRIPLTLAIIDGMKLRVGRLVFIVPMLSIQESFKPNDGDVFLDPDGSEMIMIRGECYPVFRLYRIFDVAPDFESFDNGILIMISTEDAAFCLFVDELIGEQQAVIKPLPEYIQKHNTGMHGIGGCAVLGDGSISLIIDINSLVQG